MQDAWVMFDHVKCVELWTIMACHVYDATYHKVLIIAICNMQLEDMDVQCVLWLKLNDVMFEHTDVKPNFKGFMVYNGQTNWNTMTIH